MLLPGDVRLGGFDAPESQSLCEERAPESWQPGRRVTDDELANLKRQGR